MQNVFADSRLHFASHLLMWQVQDPAYCRATHKQHPLLFSHQGLDVTHRHTHKKKVGHGREWQQSRNTAERTEGCWAFRSGRSLAQSTVTTQHHNTPGLTHRTVLTDKHSARGDLIGWPEGEVGREDGVDMRVWVREQQRKLLPLVCVAVWMPRFLLS